MAVTSLDRAFRLKNLEKAWSWTLSNRSAGFKSGFRELYAAYSTMVDDSLERLRDELTRGVYSPGDACKRYTLKESGILRPITLIGIEDQIVYQALVNIVADEFARKARKYYLKRSFGNLYAGRTSRFFYRRWEDGYRAFSKSIRQAYADGYRWAASFDLTACYDSIDHNVLRQFLADLGLDKDFKDFLLDKCLRKWTRDIDAKEIYQGHGIPQGPLPSGLLAEVVLHHFDLTVPASIKSIRYLRYVDDIRVYAKNEHDLRHVLVLLDLESKNIGLFPQSSKINIHQVEKVDIEVKGISNPTESRKVLGGHQASVRKRLVQLSPRYTVADQTRFKFVLAYANPSVLLGRRLMKILERQPHLYPEVFRYFGKWKSIPSDIASSFARILDRESMYPSYCAAVLNSAMGRVTVVSEFTKYVRRSVQNLQTGRTGLSELWATAQNWLLSYRLLSFDDTVNAFETSTNWSSKLSLLPNVQVPFIGNPSAQDLFNRLIRDESRDVAIMAAYRLIAHGLSITGRRAGVNPAAEILLQRFGLIRRRSRICGVCYAFRGMLV